MICLVAEKDPGWKDIRTITPEESLKLLGQCSLLQYDSETDGRDCRVNNLLSMQFGNSRLGFQMVIDTGFVSPAFYKDILESRWLVGHNLKFDIGFLYDYGIAPLNVYDTMIVEQLLRLGWPTDPADPLFRSVSYAAVAGRRLGVDIDKSIRGQIRNRGLDEDVIRYAAKDVEHLEAVMRSQVAECREKDCVEAAKLECSFVPVVAYMEWSGARLDADRWKAKMRKDAADTEAAEKALNDFVLSRPELSGFTRCDLQGDLFTGFDPSPKCTVQWSSPQQVAEVAKALGFDTKVPDKKTGSDKDSVLRKHLQKQKGVNDEFLRLYLGDEDAGLPGYQGARKRMSSFGQGHLNAVNPKTGRIHTLYKQLGADTGRMSSGSKSNNDDLARLKGLPVSPSLKQKKAGLGCPFVNMQQLPHDEMTRSCFRAEPGNLWVSCDYSAIESRLGADIYQEPAMIREYLEGSGDIHSLVAKAVFEELKDVPVKDIKKKHPRLRSKAKPVEFSQQFGGSAFAIQNALGCSLEKAKSIADAYAKGFKGIADFKAKGSRFVRKNGYILLCPLTGHKTWWPGFEQWKDEAKTYTPEFWDKYRTVKEAYLKNRESDPGVPAPLMIASVREHFSTVSKWERKALNSVTQGVGAIILKESQVMFFRWVVKRGLLGKAYLCCLCHDEANWEFPASVPEFPARLKSDMEAAASKYCKSLPIPAVAETGECWIH